MSRKRPISTAAETKPRAANPARQGDDAPASSTWPYQWVALAIVALAAALRLYDLGGASLWADEVLTVSIAGSPLDRIPAEVRQAEQTPPLLHFIWHLWMNAYGLSEFSVRLPAAIFSTLAVWLTYRLGLQLFGPREGCAAALLMSVSGFQVSYAQEARVYSLLLVLGLTSCIAFVSIIRTGGWKSWIGYVLSTGALYWAHLHGVFVVAAQMIAWTVLYLSRRRSTHPLTPRPAIWAVLWIAPAILFAPWIPTIIHWVRSVSGGFWIPPMPADFLPRTYALYAGSYPLLILIVWLSIWGVMRVKERWIAVLLIGLIIVPVFVPYLISVATRPLFLPRYAIITSAALVIIAARGLTALPGRWAEMIILAAMVGLSLYALPDGRNTAAYKPDVRSAGRFIVAKAKPDDVIFVNAGFHRLSVLHYLRDHFDEFTIPKTAEEIPAPSATAPAAQLWAITLIDAAGKDMAPAGDAPMRAGWVKADITTLSGVRIERYCRPR